MAFQQLSYKKALFLAFCINCRFKSSKERYIDISKFEDSVHKEKKKNKLPDHLVQVLRFDLWDRLLESMSKLFIFCVISVFCVGLVAGQEAAVKKDGYDTKYDNINLDELLKNDRLRKNYVKCLLNEGPCTPDAQELKSKPKKSPNPIKVIIESITLLKDSLVRLASRRHSDKLLKMHREAKNRFRNSHTLSN